MCLHCGLLEAGRPGADELYGCSDPILGVQCFFRGYREDMGFGLYFFRLEAGPEGGTSSIASTFRTLGNEAMSVAIAIGHHRRRKPP